MEKLDDNLRKIKELKWLPWIGDNYNAVPQDKKLLIVGESHYHDTTPQSIQKHNDANYTRAVIEELAIDRFYYGTKIFPNLHRALLQNDEFDTEIFWNLIAYYNFVQRTMETNKGRPNYDDFYSGWKTFFEVIKILRPSICLFIGTTSANVLSHAIVESSFTMNGLVWGEYISNAYAKSSIVKDQEGNEIKLIFIRHTSQMFSWKLWNEYLITVIPDEIAWLESKLSS